MQTTKNLLDVSSDEEFDANVMDERDSMVNDIVLNQRLENCSVQNDHPESSIQRQPGSRPSHKRKHEGGIAVDSKYMKMMESMGYEEGKGLGKHEQGIVEPVQASNHIAKRGLGFSIPELDADSSAEWNPMEEVECTIEEEVSWICNRGVYIPSTEELNDWLVTGPRSNSIDKETFFCDAKVVKEVISNKTIFDRLEGRELRNARSRANPYETIGSLFFLNRAAPKMANMDAVFDFMFTSPLNKSGKSLIREDMQEPFYFADVCAAPGGFSEYVLWRNKENFNGLCRAKGFGFTLKENDFKLSDFYAASPEFLEPFYGKYEDGDIFKSENIVSFADFVKQGTQGMGVHLVMADGGFSVDGQECIQEILSKQLYLCQFLTALVILREDGNFVCKVFDLFTPFSIGLVYLMYLCFEQISIHKPNTSRPANSERYLICKGKKKDTKVIEEYMFRVNKKLKKYQQAELKRKSEGDKKVNNFRQSDDDGRRKDEKKRSSDVVEIVPFEILEENREFFHYIYSSNSVLGRRQVLALKKIQTYCRNRELVDSRQHGIRSESITFWKLPIKTRVAPMKEHPEYGVDKLIKNRDLLTTEANFLSPTSLTCIKSRHDFHFVVLGSSSDIFKSDRGFFFGTGGKQVYFFDVVGREWRTLQIKIELPSNTIVFAEIVSEIMQNGRRVNALHLIDAVVLNGFDISHFKLTARHHNLKIFAKSINKPTLTDCTPIRCKELHLLREIGQVLSLDRLKCDVSNKRFYLENESSYNIVPTGVLILKSCHPEWTRVYSQSRKELYYFNINTRASTFEYNAVMNGCVRTSLERGYYWWWNDGVHINANDNMDPNQVHLFDIISFIEALPI